MHDHRAQINEHPLAHLFALDGQHFAARFAHFVGHTPRQRAHLAIRVAAGQNDSFEHLRNLGRVDDDDVATFDVFERINGDGFKFLDRECFGHAGSCTKVPSVRGVLVEMVLANVVFNGGRDQIRNRRALADSLSDAGSRYRTRHYGKRNDVA